MKTKVAMLVLALVATQSLGPLALAQRFKFGTPLKMTPHTTLPLLAAEERAYGNRRT